MNPSVAGATSQHSCDYIYYSLHGHWQNLDSWLTSTASPPEPPLLTNEGTLGDGGA